MVQQETLTLFPEVETATRKMSNAQFGALMRAVLAYRFRGENYEGEDVAVDIAFQFIASQVDRSEAAKAAKAKAGKARWGRQSDGSEKKHAAEAELSGAEGELRRAEVELNRAEVELKRAEVELSGAEGELNAAEVELKDPPIQSSPVQSSPIQSYPIQRESTAHAHAREKSAEAFSGWAFRFEGGLPLWAAMCYPGAERARASPGGGGVTPLGHYVLSWGRKGEGRPDGMGGFPLGAAVGYPGGGMGKSRKRLAKFGNAAWGLLSIVHSLQWDSRKLPPIPQL